MCAPLGDRHATYTLSVMLNEVKHLNRKVRHSFSIAARTRFFVKAQNDMFRPYSVFIEWFHTK